MAGRRRRNKPGQPLQRQRRYERKRGTLRTRLAQAHTPIEVLTASSEFLRAAMAVVPEPVARQTAARVHRMLIEEAEALFKQNLQEVPRIDRT